jgi:hypothetical protein
MFGLRRKPLKTSMYSWLAVSFLARTSPKKFFDQVAAVRALLFQDEVLGSNYPRFGSCCSQMTNSLEKMQ